MCRTHAKHVSMRIQNAQNLKVAKHYDCENHKKRMANSCTMQTKWTIEINIIQLFASMESTKHKKTHQRTDATHVKISPCEMPKTHCQQGTGAGPVGNAFPTPL